MAIIPSKEIKPAFPCSQCGLCCQQVNKSSLTDYLDRGDGTCRHLDVQRKQCSIYEQRPDICRIDKQFTLHYHIKYSWTEFVNLNTQVCKQLIDNKK